jgi:hypothetical protein
VDLFEERAIELRAQTQPRQLGDLRKCHIHLEDSRNWFKDRHALRNHHESTGVGDQHVLAGIGNEEQIMHGSEPHAVRQDCPGTDDVAAANQAQIRKSGHGDRLDCDRGDGLDSSWRDRLNSSRRERLRWDRLAWNRLARNRLDWNRLDWNRLDWNRLDWDRRQRLGSVRCDWYGSGCGLRLHSDGWQRLGCVP